MGSNQNPGKSATHRAPLHDLCTMLYLLPRLQILVSTSQRQILNCCWHWSHN